MEDKNIISHRKSVAKYDKENCTFIGLKLNNKTDQDILQAIDQQKEAGTPAQTYIKSCIRKDINNV